MAINFLDDYKKKLSSFGQGLASLAPPVAAYNAVKQVVPQIQRLIDPVVSPLPDPQPVHQPNPIERVQNFLQQGELARINYQRESEAGLVGKRLESNPVTNIGGNTLARFGTTVQEAGQAVQDLGQGKDIPGNLYRIAKVPAYASMVTPAGLAGNVVAGGIGVAGKAIENVMQGNEPLKNYGQAFGKSVDDAVVLNVIAKYNPLFKSQLEGPIASVSQVLPRMAMAATRDLVTNGILGGLQPVGIDQPLKEAYKERLGNIGKFGIQGAVFGAATQLGGDVAHLAWNALGTAKTLRAARDAMAEILTKQRGMEGPEAQALVDAYIRDTKGRFSSDPNNKGKAFTYSDLRKSLGLPESDFSWDALKQRMKDQGGFIDLGSEVNPSSTIPSQSATPGQTNIPTQDQGVLPSTTPEGQLPGKAGQGAEVSLSTTGNTRTNQVLPESNSTGIPRSVPGESALPAGVSEMPSTTDEALQVGKELLKTATPEQMSQVGQGQRQAPGQAGGSSGLNQPPSLPGSIAQDEGNGLINQVKSKVNKIYTEALDRFHPLSQLAHKVGEDQSMRNALTGYYGAASTGQYHIDYELAPILKEHNIDDLRTAAIAMRDLELAKRGIRGSNLAEDISALSSGEKLDEQSTAALSRLRKLQDKLGPEGMTALGTTLQKLYTYQDKMVQEYLVKTGIMSKEAYTAMRKNNQFYVPFKRVMDNVDEFLGMSPSTRGAGSVSGQNVVKGIKGSDKAIQDPIESIVESTYKMVGLAKRQQVAQSIVNLKSKLPEGIISKITGPVNGKSSISLFENGKIVHYAVPSEIADAAKGLSEESLNTIIKALSVPTKVFRATATGVNPEFMVPNAARDLQSAFVNVGLNPLRFIRGLAHLASQDEVYQEFLKSGGMTSRVALDRSMLRNTVEDITGTGGVSMFKPGSIYKALQTLGEYSEQPTRIAMFEKALEKGLSQGLPKEEAAIRAAYVAQEGTVNFARRGSKTQSLNAIYAFLNARAQGTDRLLRSLKNDPKGAGVRLAMITAAPAMALYAWNRNFNSYNDQRVVSPSDKKNNFIIMVDDKPVDWLGGAQYIKIPKGEVGKLANPIETFLSYVDGKGGNIADSVFSAMKSFLPVDNAGDIIPTALRPPVENVANYNFFSGQQIIPDYKKSYPPQYQSTSYTSPMYKLIGEKLGISPAQIQNIVEGYGTGWAKIASTVSQPLIPDQYKSEQNTQGATINRIPMVRRFIGGEKRTPEEQAAIDEKKVQSVQFKVNDIKAGVNRGDLPVNVGIKQIQQLESNPNATYYVDSNGKLKTADLTPITTPITTGQKLVDQKIQLDYATAVNKQISDIIALNSVGKLSDSQARQMVQDLERQRYQAMIRSGSRGAQLRSFDQIKQSKAAGSVTSEENQAVKDYEDKKISAQELNNKLQTLQVKRVRSGRGRKLKKIRIPKPKKIKVKKLKTVKLKKLKV